MYFVGVLCIVNKAGVTAGYKILPTFDSPEYGMLSGAICFDLDFPDYIINAGWNKVKVILDKLSLYLSGEALISYMNAYVSVLGKYILSALLDVGRCGLSPL